MRARAEAEATAIRGRAEIDARAARAAAEADADAIRGRAELEAAEARRAAAADREEARLLLDEARRRVDEMLAEASDVRRRAERQTLDRLLATRADLHDAIDRLSEVAPNRSSTSPTAAWSRRRGRRRSRLVPLGVVLDDGGLTIRPSAGSGSRGHRRPGEPLVRSAIGRAVDAASAPGATQAFASEQPARRRKQLRDGRNVL